MQGEGKILISRVHRIHVVIKNEMFVLEPWLNRNKINQTNATSEIN